MCISGAYQRCGCLFKGDNKEVTIEEVGGAKTKMVTLSRKNKIAIVAVSALALMLLIAVPFASAQTTSTSNTSNTKTLKAQGIAYQNVNGQITQYQANFTLTLQPTSTSAPVKKFEVVGGNVTVNGVSYSITSGNGVVRTGRHIFLLQAQGTSPDGTAVTFKLEGKYFWMWGHLYVARIGAKLQTDNGNYKMLMRSAIRV
jgi:ABC-type oligopeptide transport system substrate-binding subunit